MNCQTKTYVSLEMQTERTLKMTNWPFQSYCTVKTKHIIVASYLKHVIIYIFFMTRLHFVYCFIAAYALFVIKSPSGM